MFTGVLWFQKPKEIDDDDMYGYQSMKNENAGSSDNDDLLASVLQTEEFEALSEDKTADSFSRIFEFFASVWRGEETQKKTQRPRHCHVNILSTGIDLDASLRIEHFGEVVEPETLGASFKPLNFCQQPTNVYINRDTWCKLLGRNAHSAQVPSSFLAFLRCIDSPIEKEDAMKKHNSKANASEGKEKDPLSDGSKASCSPFSCSLFVVSETNAETNFDGFCQLQGTEVAVRVVVLDENNTHIVYGEKSASQTPIISR